MLCPKPLLLELLELSVGGGLIDHRPGVHDLLPSFPDEIGKALLLLVEILDPPENSILDGGDVLVHHLRPLVTIRIFVIYVPLQLVIEVFYHLLQLGALPCSQLGRQQLGLLADGQAFPFVDLFDLDWLDLLIPVKPRRAVTGDGVQLLAQELLVVAVYLDYLLLPRIFPSGR